MNNVGYTVAQYPKPAAHEGSGRRTSPLEMGPPFTWSPSHGEGLIIADVIAKKAASPQLF
jgi:hypothetical protein